jgi:hypothetical protein
MSDGSVSLRALPLYGLAEDCAGPRWLDTFESDVRGDIVWLAHGSDRWLFSRAVPWACVGSTNTTSATAERDLARAGLMLLLGSEASPRYTPFIGLRAWFRVFREVIQPRVEQFDSWDEVGWEVDGRPVTAKVSTFAGAWTGVASIAPASAVVVLAAGTAPSAIRLITQTNGDSYHFDMSQPITEQACERAMRAALGAGFVDQDPPQDQPLPADLTPYAN